MPYRRFTTDAVASVPPSGRVDLVVVPLMMNAGLPKLNSARGRRYDGTEQQSADVQGAGALEPAERGRKVRPMGTNGGDTGETRQLLLLIEDDARLGPLMAKVLQASFEVELVADGQQGYERARSGDHDVMVIDRRLPSVDGLTIVKRLRQDRVTTPILLLTALGTTADKVDGLDAGANDYLVKPFEYDELLARLRALTRRFDPQGVGLPIGESTFYPDDGCIYSPHIGRILLTPRECAMLRLFAENPERTFSREHILRTVFSADDQPGTVDTYVHYLRRKTDRDIVLTVRRRGYRLGQL
ncbi:response regulator transcription factor [Rathayibacter sp. KR2-224]|uniref:response regulator transcription factor n=1 Tax=Rathayibacter sp. KR2-224 TaxID=3400913 RepID=UPI003C058312